VRAASSCAGSVWPVHSAGQAMIGPGIRHPLAMTLRGHGLRTRGTNICQNFQRHLTPQPHNRLKRDHGVSVERRKLHSGEEHEQWGTRWQNCWWTSSRRSTATPLRWVGLATGASRDPSTWVARPVAGTLLHGPDGRDHIPVDVGFRGHVRRPQLRALTEMSKVLFSSTLKNPLAWANTRLIDQDPVEAVRSMKD
jgi:hypothetical protein